MKHSFAPDELTRKLRIVPPPEKPAIARYTLDDLAGYVAAESNHTKNRKLHKEWEGASVNTATIHAGTG